MGIKVVTTNAPEEDAREVSIEEAIDLQRQGLLVKGEGDVDGEGHVDIEAARQAAIDAEEAELKKRLAARKKAAKADTKKEG